MEVTVIEAEIQHLEPLVDLFDAYRVWYRKPSNKEKAFHFLKDRISNGESKVFLSKRGTDYNGFVQLYPLFSSTRMARLWLLNDLYIIPEARGNGISKLLINRAKSLAETTNAAGLMLETEKSNTIGNQLYPSTNFEVDQDHNYYFWSNPSFNA